MFISQQGLLFFFLSLPFTIALAGFLLMGHVLWIIHVVRLDARAGRTAPVRLLRFLAATATPVIGFYGAKCLGKPPAPVNRPPARSRFVLPVVTLALILVMTGILQSHSGPYDQQSLWSEGWPGLVATFIGVTVYYLFLYTILYMWAQTCGFSRHGLWTSRMQIPTMLFFTPQLISTLWWQQVSAFLSDEAADMKGLLDGLARLGYLSS